MFAVGLVFNENGLLKMGAETYDTQRLISNRYELLSQTNFFTNSADRFLKNEVQP